jgi:hypothetical protein
VLALASNETVQNLCLESYSACGGVEYSKLSDRSNRNLSAGWTAFDESQLCDGYMVA